MRAPSTPSRHRIAWLAVQAQLFSPGCLAVLLRMARGRTAPPPGSSADGQEASVRGLLNPDFWQEPDGKSPWMGPLLEALEAAQGRIPDAIGYLYLMQLSPSFRRP